MKLGSRRIRKTTYIIWALSKNGKVLCMLHVVVGKFVQDDALQRPLRGIRHVDNHIIGSINNLQCCASGIAMIGCALALLWGMGPAQ